MIQNRDIADIFTKVADFLEIEGANPFRVRAYRTVAGLAQSISELIAAESDLTQLSGIGKELDEKIREIVHTGRLAKLEELENRLPAGLHQVLKIPGLGPRKVKVLYHALNIKGLDDLKKAAREGRVRTLDGFGRKTEEGILKNIDRLSHSEIRTPWFTAEAIARSLTDYLKQDQLVSDITVAGSFRRRKETVGDLDILISCRKADAVIKSFTAYESVDRVISQGDTRSSIVLRSGLQVDLRVVPEKSYGAALHYFTGSQAHNVAIRRIGQQRGLKINEYGVFTGSRRTGGRTEEEVYASLDLPYIEPELREDRGEIQAAREKRLPRLVEVTDIRGDLHCHTTDSDGRNSLAKEIGVKVAISTDAHSVGHLDYMRLGVAQARRGWLEPSDVLNTRTLPQLQKLLRRS